MLLKEFKGPGFSMQVPTDWYITSNPQIQAMFISPPQEEGFQANLMVTINPVEDKVTLEAIVLETRRKQAAQYADYTVLEEGFVPETENKAYHRVYEWFNTEKSVQVRQKQVMLLVNQMLYVLTTTRPAVEAITENMKRVDAQLQMMLESFVLD